MSVKLYPRNLQNWIIIKKNIKLAMDGFRKSLFLYYQEMKDVKGFNEEIDLDQSLYLDSFLAKIYRNSHRQFSEIITAAVIQNKKEPIFECSLENRKNVSLIVTEFKRMYPKAYAEIREEGFLNGMTIRKKS